MNKYIKQVILPDNLLIIEKRAFNTCENLQTVKEELDFLSISDITTLQIHRVGLQRHVCQDLSLHGLPKEQLFEPTTQGGFKNHAFWRLHIWVICRYCKERIDKRCHQDDEPIGYGNVLSEESGQGFSRHQKHSEPTPIWIHDLQFRKHVHV